MRRVSDSILAFLGLSGLKTLPGYDARWLHVVDGHRLHSFADRPYAQSRRDRIHARQTLSCSSFGSFVRKIPWLPECYGPG
jgi:hypothetical protein